MNQTTPISNITCVMRVTCTTANKPVQRFCTRKEMVKKKLHGVNVASRAPVHLVKKRFQGENAQLNLQRIG